MLSVRLSQLCRSCFMWLKRPFILPYRREMCLPCLLTATYVCVLPGMRRCQSSWLETKWTWRVSGRCPPMKAAPWPKSGAAPSWRRLLRVKRWWTNSLPRSWGRWTMQLSLTKTTPAVLPATSNSTHHGCPGQDASRLVGNSSLVYSVAVCRVAGGNPQCTAALGLDVSCRLWVLVGPVTQSPPLSSASRASAACRHPVELQGDFIWSDRGIATELTEATAV